MDQPLLIQPEYRDVYLIHIDGVPQPMPRGQIHQIGRGPNARMTITTPRFLPATKTLPRRPHPIWAWKDAISRAGTELIGDGDLIPGPVHLDLEFVFPRRVDEIWKSKPMPRKIHAKKPDGDNLEKAVKDALTGVLWVDDSQVVSCYWEKWVAAGDEDPHMIARISVID